MNVKPEDEWVKVSSSKKVEVGIKIQVEKIDTIASEAVRFTESNESIQFELCEPKRESRGRIHTFMCWDTHACMQLNDRNRKKELKEEFEFR